MPSSSPDLAITQLLEELADGRGEAFDELIPEVVSSLRGIAHRQLGGERAGHTLNTTALVNEAYLKLVSDERKTWQNRAHFFAVAARAMRQVLIGYARSRNAQKRGGGAVHLTLEEGRTPLTGIQVDELVAINDALDQLARRKPRLVQVVECRFFAGLTVDETAEALGLARATVVRDWRTARAWLRHTLTDS
ncbi:MAG: sigma-70 family RNA polymerase sigma factor [Rubricoccaceae bacterium]